MWLFYLGLAKTMNRLYTDFVTYKIISVWAKAGHDEKNCN